MRLCKSCTLSPCFVGIYCLIVISWAVMLYILVYFYHCCQCFQLLSYFTISSNRCSSFLLNNFSIPIYTCVTSNISYSKKFLKMSSFWVVNNTKIKSLSIQTVVCGQTMIIFLYYSEHVNVVHIPLLQC